MKLFFFINKETTEKIESARNVVDSFEKKGFFECFFSAEDNRELFGGSKKEADAADCDVIISVGGDGTVLRAAPMALKAGKPVFGINSGRLGHLCALNACDVDSLNGDFTEFFGCTERTLLKSGHEIALNDISIMRNDFGTAISLKIESEKTGGITMRGDGVVISTPTGSTAYNLSAGGPIVDSFVGAFVITPICPHEGLTRSIVLSDESVITVSAPIKTEKRPIIYFDGVKKGTLDGAIEIRKHEKKLCLLAKPGKIII